MPPKEPTIPGRWGLPWLGDSLAFLRHPLHYLQRQEARYGPVFKCRLIGRKMVFVLGPDANQALLSTYADRVSTQEGYGDVATGLFGDALIAQDGPRHAHFRRLITPSLRPDGMAQILHRIQALIQQHLAAWAQQGRIELYRSYKHLAFAMAAKGLFDHDPGEDTPRLVAAFDRFSAGLFTPLPFKIPGTPYAKAWRARHLIGDYLQSRIDARRQQPQPAHEKPDALGLLLAGETPEGGPLSDEQIASQLLLMLFAGHDTTASLATWLTNALYTTPAWRSRLLTEQAEQAVQEDAPSPLDLGWLRQLPLLEATIREGERLYAPAPTGFRGVIEPFDIHGHTLPVGWTALYSPIFTHHMPSLYPNPERFDPERMLPPRLEHKQHPFGLIGFGAGPRKCIGEHLANVELKALFSLLLQRAIVTIEPGQDLSPIFVPSMHPAKGLFAHISQPGNVEQQRHI